MYYSNKDHYQMTNKYFEKRVAEEDTPISVSDEVQDKYQKLDSVYEDFFDDNSLHLAKVKFSLIHL
jgi:hypothetical protein